MNPEVAALAAFFRYDFDRVRRRIHMRYTGFWSADVAHDVLNAFRAALLTARADARPLTLLDDCRDWQPQSRDVNEIAKRFVDICRDFKIQRNAMIIPILLIQMHVRRTLADFDECEIFGTYEEADRWLAEVEPGAQE